MKSMLIISTLLFSGLIFSYSPTKNVGKAKAAKAEITKQVESVKDMKQKLNTKKGTIAEDIKKRDTKAVKKEFSKLNEKEDASEL